MDQTPAEPGRAQPSPGRTGWRRIVLAVCLVAPAGSLSLNVGLFLYALGRYRSEQMVRLDPTNAEQFVARNAALAPAGEDRPRIVLFGDSRIAMWSPPLRVENAEIVNQGWSGETTGQAALRLDRDVLALKPRLVIMQYGINDLKGIGLLPEREEEIVSLCRRNLAAMVEKLRVNHVPVLLLTIFPVGPVSPARWPIWSDRTLSAVARVNRELLTLAGPDVVVVDCDPVLGVAGRMRGGFALDDFHLTRAAYDALNHSLEPRLPALLSSMATR